MKKLLLVLSLIVISLNGCYIRAHDDDGYHRDRDRHEDNEHHRHHHDDHDGDHNDDRRDGGRY